jgi:hypothetical protein
MEDGQAAVKEITFWPYRRNYSCWYIRTERIPTVKITDIASVTATAIYL